MANANQEEIELSRDVDAIIIPHGSTTRMPKGTRVKVLQELGGSVTVTTEYGGLYRVDPENLDALGMEAKPSVPAAAEGGDKPLEERVWDVLRSCYDPEIPVNIVELGLVYDCRISEPDTLGKREASIQMTLTAPGCGMGDVLAEDVRKRLEKLPEIGGAKVEVVFDPPWNQSMMSEAARLQLGFY
jgi:probable FeS assembly SUF system protein SufT